MIWKENKSYNKFDDILKVVKISKKADFSQENSFIVLSRQHWINPNIFGLANIGLENEI